MISLKLTRYRSPQLRSATVANKLRTCYQGTTLESKTRRYLTSRDKPKNGLPSKVKYMRLLDLSGTHLDPKVIPTDPKVATKEAKGLQRHPKTLRGNHFSTKNSNVLDLPEQAQKQTSKQSQVHAPFGVFWNPFGSQRATSWCPSEPSCQILHIMKCAVQIEYSNSIILVAAEPGSLQAYPTRLTWESCEAWKHPSTKQELLGRRSRTITLWLEFEQIRFCMHWNPLAHIQVEMPMPRAVGPIKDSFWTKGNTYPKRSY